MLGNSQHHGIMESGERHRLGWGLVFWASAPRGDPCHLSHHHPFLAELSSLHPQRPHGE